MPISRTPLQTPFTRRALMIGAGASFLAPAIAGADVPRPLTPEVLLRLQGRYLPYYLELTRQASTGEGHGGLASQVAAMVGDDQTALRLASSPRPPDEAAALPQSPIVQDALQAIVEASSDHQVVILNEAHHVSAHRAFALKVLRALRDTGFTVFAAETFSPPQGTGKSAARCFEAGMPVTPRLGYYTLDPVFAEMVREAAEMGYALADYEQRPSQSAPADASPEESFSTREQAQAENFIEVLRRHSGEKVFVLCGYNHLLEQPRQNDTWFASRLRTMTGIDPLTIEQSENWPRVSPPFDPPHVRGALSLSDSADPFAVWDGDHAFTGRVYSGGVDLAVYHPRLRSVGGRPGWLHSDPARHVAPVDVPIEQSPQLLQAFHSNEGWGAVPADQMLIPPGAAAGTLLLRPGEYILRVELPDEIRTLGLISVPHP